MPRDRYDDRDDYDDRLRRRREYDGPPRSGGGAKAVLLILGIVGGVLVLVVGGLVVLLLPAVQKVREAAARAQATNNIRQLSLAADNYNAATGRMPGPFVDQTDRGLPVPANPSDRMSWRVALLPYMEQDALYHALDLSQPWNSPANSQYTSVPIKAYGDPLDPPTGATTRFRCFYNNGALFDTDPSKRVAMYGITDGSSNTILFAESSELVPWAQFNEWAFDPKGTPPPLGHPSREVFAAGMADGSVKWVKKTVSPATLKAAVTHNGGEVLGSDW